MTFKTYRLKLNDGERLLDRRSIGERVRLRCGGGGDLECRRIDRDLDLQNENKKIVTFFKNIYTYM